MENNKKTKKREFMKMFYLPEIWLTLFVVFGPGIELLPSLRAFRAEQAKHPRFTDVPGHRRAKLWLIPAWLVPITSMVMCIVSVCNGLEAGSARNLFVALGMLPLVLIVMVVTRGTTKE